VDLSNYPMEAVDRILADVIDRADTSFARQVLISHLLHGVVFAGGDIVARWQARAAPYPGALARAMVEENLSFAPWWGREMLAERDELVLLYECCVTIAKKILMMLMGINRIYHPGFKWVDRLIEQMPIAPLDLAAKLRVVFRAEPAAALPVLHRLIEETFALVEEHMPEVDTTAARE